MEKVEVFLDNLLQRHCQCGPGENRVLLESISICPSCESIYSTLIYEIPPEDLKAVLVEMDGVMSRHGIQRRGEMPDLSLLERETEH